MEAQPPIECAATSFALNGDRLSRAQPCGATSRSHMLISCRDRLDRNRAINSISCDQMWGWHQVSPNYTYTYYIHHDTSIPLHTRTFLLTHLSSLSFSTACSRLRVVPLWVGTRRLLVLVLVLARGSNTPPFFNVVEVGAVRAEAPAVGAGRATVPRERFLGHR